MGSRGADDLAGRGLERVEVGNLVRIQSGCFQLGWLSVKRKLTNVLYPLPIIRDHIRCKNDDSQSTRLVEDLQRCQLIITTVSVVQPTQKYFICALLYHVISSVAQYEKMESHFDLPPCSYHCWVHPHLPVDLQLDFTIVIRLVFRMRANDDCRHDIWRGQDFFLANPLVVYAEA